HVPPPGGCLADLVAVAMVPAAERNGYLMADFAAQCPVLGKGEVVCICRPSAENQAGMLGDRSDVIPVTHAAGFRNRQRALINRGGASASLQLHLAHRVLETRRSVSPLWMGLRRRAQSLCPKQGTGPQSQR